jgi:cytochrome c556
MTRTFVWLLLVSVVLLLSSVAMTQQPTVKPVASVTQLMRAMIIPASNALFNVARQAPTNDKEWAAVENNAVILGESGNLLMMGSRAMNTEAWMKSSQALADAGALALKAAEARNVEAVTDAGNLIVDACETCHEKHWDRSQQN